MDDDKDAAGAGSYGEDDDDDDGILIPSPCPPCREGGLHRPALGSSRSLDAADADTLSGTAPRANGCARVAPTSRVGPSRLRGTPRRAARSQLRPSASFRADIDPRDPPPPTPDPRPRHAVAPATQPLRRCVRPPPAVEPGDSPGCAAACVITVAIIVAVLPGGVIDLSRRCDALKPPSSPPPSFE